MSASSTPPPGVPRPPRSATSGSTKASLRDDSTLKEEDDLLSDYTSETSFFDDVGSPSMIAAATSLKEEWSYSCYRAEGKVHILGEWTSKTKASRMVVIGPDWPCVLMTYITIVVPSVFVYLYIVHDLAEEIIFFLLFGLCIFGLTTVFIADPGLVRKYHHARDRNWTYCDPCESFRPPHTVHCSSCQVCVADYDVSMSLSFSSPYLISPSTRPPHQPSAPLPLDRKMRRCRKHSMVSHLCFYIPPTHPFLRGSGKSRCSWGPMTYFLYYSNMTTALCFAFGFCSSRFTY